MPECPVTAQTTATPTIDESTRMAMWAVYAKHYDGIERAVFEADLADKRHVVLLKDRKTRKLGGFCTLSCEAHHLRGREFSVVFTGDTIIESEYRGHKALAIAFFRYLLWAKLRRPFRPVYWFLVSKGYKTYLTMVRNFAEFYPRNDRPTPAWAEAVLNHLGHSYSPDAWNPVTGVVEHAGRPARLKPGVAELDARAIADPDVEYFLRKNPGHARGHELAVIGIVNLALVRRFCTRIILQSLRRTSRAGA